MRPHRKQIAALVVAAAFALSGAIVSDEVRAVEPSAATASPARPTASSRWSGQGAIDRLGDRLPVVAAEHGKTPEELRLLLLEDRSLFVDGNDRLLYVDAPAQASEIAAAGPAGTLDPEIPDSDTFLLHSKVGSARVIFLDFDGHSLDGTVWSAGAFPCEAEPYDIDGIPGSFSPAELASIKSIWRRVAEDYAPFDVDVTTQDPGVDAINRSARGDNLYGARVVITTSTPAKPCNLSPTLYQSACGTFGCGGIAYNQVFNRTDNGFYQPALVFTNGTGPDTKTIAEAATHEVGHQLGLNHDGLRTPSGTLDQTFGQGNWAPIMGQGRARPIVQWSKSEYTGATNTQDDLAVMTSFGLAFRADDHGDTARTATPIALGSVVDGVIGTAADVDAFRFSATAGTSATITVDPALVSPNLDVRIELRNSKGTVVATSDPASGFSSQDFADVASGLSASISQTFITTDTYSVLVSGVGFGSPLTDGYSDYGSLGTYRLTYGVAPVVRVSASVVLGTDPLTVAFTGSGSTDPAGGALTYAWDFGNSVTSALADPTYTYDLPRTYVATLRVTSSSGRSAFASVTITVQQRIDVAGLTVTGTFAKGAANATANVTVRDVRTGVGSQTVPGVTVSGTWSVGGSVLSTRTATTDANGVAALTSGSIKATTGTTLRFCVTQLAKPGSTWTTELFAPPDATDCAAWTVP